MAYEENLCGQFINESFQRLLQVSGSDNIILNGTGSIVDTLTVSGNLIVINDFTIAGDTYFGDNITDNHYFTGSVNISGSLHIDGIEASTVNDAKRIMYMSIGI